jgi:hypothetical protein
MHDPINIKTVTLRANRYDALLRERALAGMLLVEHLSHRRHEAAELIYSRVEALENELAGYRRWSHQYPIIQAMEEARWHSPDGPSPEPQSRPCLLCAKQTLGLNLDLPLPAVRGVA